MLTAGRAPLAAQALQWVARLRSVGADVSVDAHKRHGADQQEYAHDDHGWGVTPRWAKAVAEQPGASCGVCLGEQQQDRDGHSPVGRRLPTRWPSFGGVGTSRARSDRLHLAGRSLTSKVRAPCTGLWGT